MTTEPEPQDRCAPAEYVPLEIGVVTSHTGIEDPSASMFANFGADQEEIDRQLRRLTKRARNAPPENT